MTPESQRDRLADAASVLDYITGSTGGANRRMPSQGDAAAAAHRLREFILAAGVRVEDEGLREALHVDDMEWWRKQLAARNGSDAGMALFIVIEIAAALRERLPPTALPDHAAREGVPVKDVGG